MVRALRIAESLGGRVIYVDEDSRRVVFVAPARSIDGVSGLIAEYANGYTVNVKASCETDSLGAVEERVKGFKHRVRVESDMYYLSFNDRIVEVHFRGGRRVDVKIGGRSSLVKPIPPSVFNLSIEDAREALRVLGEILGVLGLGDSVD